MDIKPSIFIVNGCGIGNVLKGFISFLSLNENTKIEYDNNYILGDYQNIFDEKHILHPEDLLNENYTRIFSWRFLILKEEESVQKHLENELTDFSLVDKINNIMNIFSTSVAIDSYYKRELISNAVYDRIMKGIHRITWNTQIMNELKKLEEKITYPSLGISVRTWDASHETNVTSYRDFNIERYKTAIETIINDKNWSKENSIYISYDNHKVEPYFLELLKDYNVIHFNKENLTQLQYVIIKILLLSKCTHLICNRISTFSELVYWFGECNQTVIDL